MIESEQRNPNILKIKDKTSELKVGWKMTKLFKKLYKNILRIKTKAKNTISEL